MHQFLMTRTELNSPVMTFVIVENLRGFFNSRPPLVVFMICLASFAIALITFAYIVKTRDLPNPDVTEDWNTFLEKLSHLKFCVSNNASSHNLSAPSVKVGDLSPGDALESIKDKIIEHKVSSEPSQVSKRATAEHRYDSGNHASPLGRDRAQPTARQPEATVSPSLASVSNGGLINETFHLNIEFVPSPEYVASTFRSVILTTDMTGNMLSLKGSHKEQHVLMTMTFPTNESDCLERTDNACSLYVINACVTFTGPATLLPLARHAKKDVCSVDGPVTGGSMTRPMAVGSSRDMCLHGSRVSVQYSFDDSLTVLLSQDERSVINLHLMRTSYFLFVMVVTLFCYAAVKGRPGKVKAVVYVQHDKTKTFSHS
jgi:hypothetical protein